MVSGTLPEARHDRTPFLERTRLAALDDKERPRSLRELAETAGFDKKEVSGKIKGLVRSNGWAR